MKKKRRQFLLSIPAFNKDEDVRFMFYRAADIFAWMKRSGSWFSGNPAGFFTVVESFHPKTQLHSGAFWQDLVRWHTLHNYKEKNIFKNHF